MSEAPPRPSLRLERRTVLAAGAAALFTSWLPARLARAEPGAAIELDDLFERAQELYAKYLRGGDPAEVVYLHEVAALAARLGPVPTIELSPPFKQVMSVGIQRRGGGLVLIDWRMEPNRIYPAHNHPNYAGFTVGLEGRCRMRNFQAPSRYPSTSSKENFKIRETQNAVLAPGDIASMMSTDRDNIHQLHAGDAPVRGLDVTTLVGQDVGFAFLKFDERSRNPEGEYEARWAETLGGYSVP